MVSYFAGITWEVYCCAVCNKSDIDWQCEVYRLQSSGDSFLRNIPNVSTFILPFDSTHHSDLPPPLHLLNSHSNSTMAEPISAEISFTSNSSMISDSSDADSSMPSFSCLSSSSSSISDIGDFSTEGNSLRSSHLQRSLEKCWQITSIMDQHQHFQQTINWHKMPTIYVNIVTQKTPKIHTLIWLRTSFHKDFSVRMSLLMVVITCCLPLIKLLLFSHKQKIGLLIVHLKLFIGLSLNFIVNMH